MHQYVQAVPGLTVHVNMAGCSSVMSKHSDPVWDSADPLKGSRFCLCLPLTFAQ